MAQPFPEEFDRKVLQGPRARQFDAPYDLFHQLVAAGLREEFGSFVEVSDTLGNDAGIDALITAGSAASPWDELRLPAIVECKFHESGPTKWSKVHRAARESNARIEKRQQAGFVGAAAWWADARTYVYCVSVRLNIDQAKRLAALWRTFFASIGVAIEVRVLHWGVLRDWLDGNQRLIDNWVGLSRTGLVPHLAYVEYLDQFKKYLLAQNLEFVAPAPDAPWHPDELAQRLIASDDGILLTGPGGSGKSRTLMEVANRVHDSGWRVLHLTPTSQGLDLGALERELLPGTANTLLLADYVDRLHLDFAGVRRQLQPEARARQKRIAILASTRISWLRTEDAERDELFDIVELGREESQSVQLTRTILQRVAPAANRWLGFDRVARICGDRPIITLLIAAELERRVQNRGLEIEVADTVRSSALGEWLHRRLREDELIAAAGGTLWDPIEAPPGLIAAAAILACAPGHVETLTLVAASGLPGSAVESGSSARRILGNLMRLGWVERRHGSLETAHDVVVDEVLTHVIRDHMSESLRESALHAMLRSSLASAACVGHLMSALGRVLDLFEGGTFPERTVAIVGSWVVEHSMAIGQLFAAENAREAIQSLLALIASPFGSHAINHGSAALLGSWLERHGLEPEAGQLLYRALQALAEGQGGEVLRAAVAWLDVPANLTRVTAPFVIATLLRRRDVAPADVKGVVAKALGWIGENSKRFESTFVLTPLLRRGDLTASEAATATQLAEQWLSALGDSRGGPFVYTALLKRRDTSEETFEKWLLTPNLDLWMQQPGWAKFTVIEVLRSPRANRWFEADVARIQSGVVFRAQLLRGALDSDFSRNLYSAAATWSEAHLESWEAPRVLVAGLDRVAPPVAELRELRRVAIKWIEQFRGRSEVPSVLRTLLRKSPPLDDDHIAIVGSEALRWLDDHLESGMADYVFRRLLRDQRIATDIARRTLGHALKWLRRTSPTRTRGFVLGEVVSRAELLGDQELLEVLSDLVRWYGSYAIVIRTDLFERALSVARSRLGGRIVGELETIAKTQRVPPALALSVGEIGSIRDGEVINVLEYGFFVRLGDVTGFVHRTDIAWEWPIPAPAERVMRGEAVRVRVLSLEPEEAKVTLGLRQVQELRWLEVRSAYAIGQRVEATVAGKSARGVVGVCRDGARLARLNVHGVSGSDARLGEVLVGEVWGYDDDFHDVLIR